MRYWFLVALIVSLVVAGSCVSTSQPELLEVTSVTPDTGSPDGGSIVAISGEGFDNGATVYFIQRDTAKEATNVFVDSSTTIYARTPPHDVGYAHIRVTNPDGNRATLENGFRYSDLSAPSQLLVEATVLRVIDGDTIEVDISGNLFRVRYIGIDTPEVGEQGYSEATQLNSQLVSGKVVKLEKDVSETDQYGRLLRYVYVDDAFVNAELVRLGYAQVFTYPPDVKYADYFLSLQQEAIAASRGLWGNTQTETNRQFVGSVNSDVYHYSSCRYVDQIYTQNLIWFSSSADARAHGYRPCMVCNPP